MAVEFDVDQIKLDYTVELFRLKSALKKELVEIEELLAELTT